VRFSRFDASTIGDDSLDPSKELTLNEPHLEKAPFEDLCDDDVMVSAASGIGDIDSICVEQLDLTPLLSALLLATPSHLHASHKPLGDIRESHPSFYPYCIEPLDLI